MRGAKTAATAAMAATSRPERVASPSQAALTSAQLTVELGVQAVIVADRHSPTPPHMRAVSAEHTDGVTVLTGE